MGGVRGEKGGAQRAIKDSELKSQKYCELIRRAIFGDVRDANVEI